MCQSLTINSFLGSGKQSRAIASRSTRASQSLLLKAVRHQRQQGLLPQTLSKGTHSGALRTLLALSVLQENCTGNLGIFSLDTGKAFLNLGVRDREWLTAGPKLPQRVAWPL